ncbi:ParB/RepB/Spo0J family partition protein [Anaerospora hongkongensis]|uniref:ParB/RepB/Spo0J family partition protein n=1 Tax=Anaerospora hongkongensis TaxID=244830 RepID=UPI002898CAAF|nr:ParB/RepB/Spo0J family partition protein [Anaerospora hongkongensis]
MSTSTNKQKQNSKLSKFASMVVPGGQNAPEIRDFGFSGFGRREEIASEQLKTVEAPLPGYKLMKVKINQINPAPRTREWNFWEEQSHEAIIRRAISFLNEGQLSPIIIREYKYNDPSKKYQCLAGHTRTQSAELLVEEGYEEWQELWAFVYPEGACDDLQARRIIHYSNTEQRTNMSAKEKLNCFIFEWLDETNRERSQNASQLISKLAEKYSLKKTRAYELKAIAEKVIPEMRDLIMEDTITLQDAKHIAKMGASIQNHLYNNYRDRFSQIKFKTLVGLNTSEIDRVLKKNDQKVDEETYFKVNSTTSTEKQFTIKIPVKAETQFRKAILKLYAKYGFPE